MTEPLPRSHESEFLLSAFEPKGFPELGVPEVVLIGRSNVGKSSFLNALTGRKQFARTSRTPGRTRSINFYRIQQAAFVDLPGYGYARVSKEERERWKNVIESYLARTAVRLALLIVDVRTGATPSDQTMAEWLRFRGLRTLVALTKIDKIAKGKVRMAAQEVALSLKLTPTEVVPMSALNRDGVRAVWKAVGDALAADAGVAPQPQTPQPSSPDRQPPPSESRA